MVGSDASNWEQLMLDVEIRDPPKPVHSTSQLVISRFANVPKGSEGCEQKACGILPFSVAPPGEEIERKPAEASGGNDEMEGIASVYSV